MQLGTDGRQTPAGLHRVHSARNPVFSAAVVQQHDDYIIFIIKKMSKTEESHDILHVLLFFNERLDLDLGYLMWMFTPMK